MKTSPCVVASLLACFCLEVSAADTPFDGLNLRLGKSLPGFQRANALHQPGKFHGRKRPGRHVHQRAGRQRRGAGSGPGLEGVAFRAAFPRTLTFTLAEISGPGAIQQIWMTPAPLDKTRWFILRMYWDDETEPSVECPLGDFFACGLGTILPDQFAARVRQSRQRVQFLLADAVPQKSQDHAGKSG